MHIHVLIIMYLLCRNFERIPIKFDFLCFKVAQKFNKRSCTIVQGIFSKIATRESFIVIIFSDTHTGSYVVLKF